jgi:hypothetical protein
MFDAQQGREKARAKIGAVLAVTAKGPTVRPRLGTRDIDELLARRA